ncbi:MAG: signal peptidase I [Pirellulales bacterium]|nr:signal peptidase I [Pirellulales bacterium]
MAISPQNAATEAPSSPAVPPEPEGNVWRETLESVLIAFVMACMFRNFLAEPFVIPTGSMAPTLQGKHYDLVCPQCGTSFRKGYSDSNPAAPGAGLNATTAACCPNCQYVQAVQPETDKYEQVFEGDRIVVNKFIYDFHPPERWDVIVFKYPEDPKTNYIKRLIGLPGETLKIEHGDIWLKPPSGANLPAGTGPQWEIARKPNLAKLRAMLQPVHDQDHQPEELLAKGWPSRWQNWAMPNQPGWKTSADQKVFTLDKTTELTSLRYLHLLVDQYNWDQVDPPGGKASLAQPSLQPVPQLIRDFYPYNYAPFPNARDGIHWVGDLALMCEVQTAEQTGLLRLELVKGGRVFHAEIDLASGIARLRIPGVENYQPKSTTRVWSSATKQVMFANVDDQLWLVINGQPVEFDSPTTYDHLGNTRPAELPSIRPGEQRVTDHSPAGISVQGSAATVSSLRIMRDVFYTGSSQATDGMQRNQIELKKNPADPSRDQFFMLGDNSPSSSDSRYWLTQGFVERRQLVGKAMAIYWPHSWPTTYSLPIMIRGVRYDFPFMPNWSRMNFIR